MDHVAIMKKSWRLLPKILAGEKTIESRWYQTKHVPWDKIGAGDTIYFKNSAEPVTAKAKVSEVLQFQDLTPATVGKILDEYGAQDGIPKGKSPKFFELFKNKKYCLLIFLKEVQRIKPFNVNKSGFGAMSAWISVGQIEGLKRQTRSKTTNRT